MRLPNIVAIEGIDASGKATQAKMLADYLDRLNNPPPTHRDELPNLKPPCLRRSFPAYDTPLGGYIRAALSRGWEARPWIGGLTGKQTHAELNALALQCLMTVNRHELADEIEYACVVERRPVVLDRYWASAVAYGAADGLDPKWLELVHTRLPKAHHVLVDVSVEESFRRRPERRDGYEADRGRLERARQAYLALFERKGVDVGMLHGGAAGHVSPSGWAIVNGEGTAEQVHRAILMVLGLGGAVP